MCGVKEPDGRVDADAKTAKIGRIGLETIDDGNVGKRAQFPGRSENLSSVRGSTWMGGLYLRPKGQSHPFVQQDNPLQ